MSTRRSAAREKRTTRGLPGVLLAADDMAVNSEAVSLDNSSGCFCEVRDGTTRWVEAGGV
jgi:hypothetical protein